VNRTLGTISGGEAQRVVLARALCQQAPVLVLDEPTSGLDLGHQQQVLELVDGLRREHSITVVAAMHELILAGQYADRLVLLDRGAIAASGTADDVLTEANLGRYFLADVARYEADNQRSVLVPVRRKASTPEGPNGSAPAPVEP